MAARVYNGIDAKGTIFSLAHGIQLVQPWTEDTLLRILCSDVLLAMSWSWLQLFSFMSFSESLASDGHNDGGSPIVAKRSDTDISNTCNWGWICYLPAICRIKHSSHLNTTIAILNATVMLRSSDNESRLLIILPHRTCTIDTGLEKKLN